MRRELIDVRAEQLRFSDDEATTLLNRMLGLELEAADVARLQHRTEGWAAGLQLAALSLSGRDDRRHFISSFAGDDRPIVDYLGFEVLDGQPPDVREFLLQTSVLERLSGSLCDHVTGRDDSALKLDELERAGLLLLPLDSRREWYRYHHLFAGLLRHELTRTRPGLAATLHERASAWYRDSGSVAEAVEHAIAGGNVAVATELITKHWYAELQRGRIETVAGWLEALGDDVVRAEARLCLTKAWIAVNTGRLDEVAEWIDAAEGAGADEPVLESGVASLQEIHRYMDGDVERAVEAGRRSVQSGETPWRPVGCPVLGIALFWSGRYGEAAVELATATDTAKAAGNHLAVIHASGALAAMRAERGELEAADAVARNALRLAQERGLNEHWAAALARVVHGRALEQRGLIEAAADEIDRGVELSAGGVATMEIAYARLAQADARRLLRRSRRRRGRCAPGSPRRRAVRRPGAAARDARADRAPAASRVAAGARRRRRAARADELTERELSVLRLLPTGSRSARSATRSSSP